MLKSTSATVYWTEGSDGDSGILGYRITVNGAALTKLASASARTSKVTLRAGSNTVAVAAVNQAGVSATGAPVTVTVDAKAPAAATGLVLAAGTQLSWTAAKDTGTPVTFLVSLDGKAGTVTAGTSLQVDTPAGHHTWTFVSQDAAGNQSSAARLTVVR
jgi:hypothetical protein